MTGLLNMDEKMKMIKWEEIGISDDFMFGKVMQNPRLCKKLLETILGIEIEKSVVIFICPFDVFGKNRCRYTFENLCLEEKNLPLGDGTTKIFLNAMGTMDDVSPELKSFLDYVAGKKNDDSFVKELDEEVRKVRESKEWRRDYMTLLMRDQENIEKGIKIGLEQGIEQGLEQGIEQGLEQGIEKGLEQGKLEMIVQLIHDGVLTVREGAGRLHMSESDLVKYL